MVLADGAVSAIRLKTRPAISESPPVRSEHDASPLKLLAHALLGEALKKALRLRVLHFVDQILEEAQAYESHAVAHIAGDPVVRLRRRRLRQLQLAPQDSASCSLGSHLSPSSCESSVSGYRAVPESDRIQSTPSDGEAEAKTQIVAIRRCGSRHSWRCRLVARHPSGAAAGR